MLPYSCQILDHGYLSLVTTWGSDESIIEAARQSTSGSFRGWGPNPCPDSQCRHGVVMDPESMIPMVCEACNGKGTVPGDEKLLRTLWTKQHTSPFEMPGFTVEVQAPIFVFREWHRHRTQSFNEMSGRYTKLPDLYYVPSMERLMNSAQSKTNRQSSGAGITEVGALAIEARIRSNYEDSRLDYEALLASGVAREVARLVLPVAQYSRMRASANLWNWLRFLRLRTHPDAQWEIRQYAAAIAVLVEREFPRVYDLWYETLSA